MGAFQKVARAYDRFWFQSCDPVMCSVMRVASGLLLIIFLAVWLVDARLWFSSEGLLRSETAQEMARGQHWSLLFFLPDSAEVVQACLVVALLQAAMLLLGVASRIQAACLFVWLTSFQHRNPLIADGEDTVLRLWMFFMIWMPLDHRWSLGRWLRGTISKATPADAWSLRLVQLELTAIYLSTAWSNWLGETWRDGSALFYVSRMDDVFGRWWLPETIFVTDWMVRCSTWSVLLLETLLPLLLWIPRCRRIGIVLAVALHLAIEYSMHLFLFEWIMIVGLLSFYAVPPRPFYAEPPQPPPPSIP